MKSAFLVNIFLISCFWTSFCYSSAKTHCIPAQNPRMTFSYTVDDTDLHSCAIDLSSSEQPETRYVKVSCNIPVTSELLLYTTDSEVPNLEIEIVIDNSGDKASYAYGKITFKTLTDFEGASIHYGFQCIGK